VKAFSGSIARMLVKAHPDLFTAKIAKARRPNKIFADYLRNSETASAIAAYSPRARANAGVSVPLSWDELDPKDERAGTLQRAERPQAARISKEGSLGRLLEDPSGDHSENAGSGPPLKFLR